jgi:tRNA G10  N-methylase Trm11
VVKNLVKTCSFSKIKGKTFRLMVMDGSRLEHVTKEIADSMKQKIAKQTGLLFSPLKADVEFWVLIRNNGAVMFGYKKEAVIEKIPLQKGELKQKVAELLVMAGKPEADDVFLDPFAGYGSIPAARIRLDTFEKIIVIEKKGLLVDELKRRFKNEKNVVIHQGDALKMNFIEDQSITNIVTDPPWGIFEELNVDIAKFYTTMLEECARVLKPDGKAIILTGQPEALQVALEGISSLQSLKEYTTLVNGKKATVFLLQKAAKQE